MRETDREQEGRGGGGEEQKRGRKEGGKGGREISRDRGIEGPREKETE